MGLRRVGGGRSNPANGSKKRVKESPSIGAIVPAILPCHLPSPAHFWICTKRNPVQGAQYSSPVLHLPQGLYPKPIPKAAEVPFNFAI